MRRGFLGKAAACSASLLRSRASSRAGAVVFALLVLATIAVFAWAQRAKRDPLVVDRVSFGTAANRSLAADGHCHKDKLRIRFRTTVSDHGTVQILKPDGTVVITLAREVFLRRYHFHTYYWNGRQRGGGTAHAGHYKLRVKLLGQGRSLVPPGTIRVLRASGKGSAC
jgi:hypothetical protein